MEFSHTLSTSTILSNGLSFPLIGLGTFKSEDIEKSLKTAIELGYRSIDTAKLYQNEKQIGKILQELFKSGKVTRSDLFITTKTYNNPALSVYDQLKESLIDLQVDYVDLCLDHWPHGFFDLQSKENKAKPRHVLWKEFEKCQREGLCKSIGVSNYNCQSLMDLLTYAEIKPVVNQIELHPYLIQKDLVEWCQKMGIHVTAYAPLCRGGADVKQAFGDVVDIFNEPILKQIAEKYKKTVAQIILNFQLKRGVSVLPKSTNEDRLKENLNCADFILQEEDQKLIFGLDKGYRTINPKKNQNKLFYPLFD